MKVTFYYQSSVSLYDTAPLGGKTGRFHFFKDAGNWFLVDSDFKSSTIKVEQVSKELALDLHEAAKNEEDLTVDL